MIRPSTAEGELGPARDLHTVDDLADSAVFLAGRATDYVSGTVPPVDAPASGRLDAPLPIGMGGTESNVAIGLAGWASTAPATRRRLPRAEAVRTLWT